ncbi:MAG: spore maturation protein A [Oscillospiraceae bacterium]|nr:spore maturation protein A [Oscillospiraceae bacterium]MBR1845322.1 spore maturation protein A [Oscillospiraceae bacterium]
MAMSWIWVIMVGLSLLFGWQNGTMAEVSAAAGTGAQSAVELCVSMAGPLCLWTGVMAVLRESGGLEKLSVLLRPVLGRLYPAFRRDDNVMESISANVSANLLGLGNAATPLGIQAARGMAERSPGVASDALCMLVVCNTASIQLIPTTIAAVRSGAGSKTPFDILPAVWLASACSVTAGILAARLFARLWRRT